MVTILNKISLLFSLISRWCCRHYLLSLIAVLAAGLAVKMGILLNDGILGRDSCFYLLIVQKWNNTGVLESEWLPPMLFVLIKGVMWLGFSAETAGILLNVILGTLIAIVAAAIAFEATHSIKVALISAFFAAVHPGINELSTEVQRDIPYLFFIGIAVLFAVSAIRGKKYYLFCASGIALAFAFLTRYESVEFLLLFPFANIVLVYMKSISVKQCILNICCLLVSFSVAIALFLLLHGGSDFFAKYQKYYHWKFIAIEQFFNQSLTNGAGNHD